MSIPFSEQPFVEKKRNLKYTFLFMLVTMLVPLFHGVLFLWIPWFLRSRRDVASLRYKKYFSFVKYFDSFCKVQKLTVARKTFFLQPSLVVVWAIHVGFVVLFSYAETDDLDNFPRSYVISKRVGRISIGCVPMVLMFVAKNNIIAALSGLTLDKSVFFHKWLGRLMFLLAIFHMAYSMKYWIDLKFYVMIEIPPQIFGFIAFSCLGMLNVASLRFIRHFAFDLFLVQHRVFNFIMLLLAYFHSKGNRAAVLLGVHLLVLDRITSRVLGIIHKRKSPTKGISDFEILDDTTIRVSIPIKIKDSDNQKWWWCFVPRYGNWRAGQHVYLNVFKVSMFQYHPFTIGSLSDSGNIVLVIKVHKGFTRKLKNKLLKLKEESDEENRESHNLATSESSQESEIQSQHNTTNSISSSSELIGKNTDSTVYTPSVSQFKEIIDSFEESEIIKLKAGINGPYGGNYQPLLRFDLVVFFSAGSGASFTLPVALDLLKTIQEREEVGDYMYRPRRTAINIVMALKKVENVKWYDHLWKEFLPFLNSGRAHLSLHITQEVADAADNLGEDEDVEIEEQLAVQGAGPSIEKHDNERVVEYLTGNSSEKRTQSYSTASSYSIVDNSGFSITYARPDFETIINDAVRLVCSKEYRKSFACLGCGPDLFNGEIKRFCNKNRWVEGAPDVYCYTESFG